MTDTTRQLAAIEARLHLAWADLRELQRRIADPDQFYATPHENQTAGATLLTDAVSDALNTINRATADLERIRLTMLMIDHGPSALAARYATAAPKSEPGPRAARAFAMADAERGDERPF